MKQILINCEELQTRVAVVENGKLQDFFIERRDHDRLTGSIFKGKIRNLEPSLQAAFVDIGTEKNAFLHYWDMLPATKEMLEGESITPAPDGLDRSALPPSATENSKPVGLFQRLRQHFCRKEANLVEQRPRGRSQRRRTRTPNPFTVDDIPELFAVNSDVLVQVTKGPIGTKGARVTTNLSIPGRYLVLLPNSMHVGVSKRVDDREERDRLRQILRKLHIPKGMGLICRTVGAGRKEKFFDRDLDMLLSSWQDIRQKNEIQPAPACLYEEPDLAERTLRDSLTEDVDEIVTDSKEIYDRANQMVRQLSRQERVRVRLYKNPRPIFLKYNLNSQIENVFSRQVSLPSGGYICIDETEALIAIDINSGKNRSGKDHPETILTTNLEAAEEVARQLRLRNLGGLIVVDFIDMRSKRDQQTVYRAFREALQRDRARTKVCPISPLGLVEMTRQRENESVRSTIYGRCPYCQGKGLVKSAMSMSVEIQRRLQEVLRRKGGGNSQLRVNVHPSILERLKNEDASVLSSMEQEFGGELSFRGDPDLHMEEFRLINMRTGEEI